MKIAVAMALVLALSACGGKDEPEQPVEQAAPACSDVWKVGQTLPEDYEGCMEGDSLVVPISGSDGRVVYDDRLAASPGETIEVWTP